MIPVQASYYLEQSGPVSVLKKKKVLGGVVSLCRVCLCVVLSDVLCCHYCRGCAVGCVSVGVDALDVVR